jgi:PIN domain nuclease of toxin-antitoxin system
MRLLVDTHILLWWLANDRRISPKAASLLKDPTNEVLVSAASVWEIAIKYGLGRITLSQNVLIDAVHKCGFSQLPITFEHCSHLADLPSIHRDPFDRILVAQSLSEPAMLLTNDRILKDYGSTVLLV